MFAIDKMIILEPVLKNYLIKKFLEKYVITDNLFNDFELC